MGFHSALHTAGPNFKVNVEADSDCTYVRTHFLQYVLPAMPRAPARPEQSEIAW